jgi:TRAP-type transport system small permease protein
MSTVRLTLWGRLMQACGTAAALIIGIMVVLVGYDVLARNTGLRGLAWTAEASEYGLALATLLAAPWLLWSEQHVRLDLLQMTLSARAWARLYRAAAMVCLLVSATLAWYSVSVIFDLRQSGAVIMKTFTFPEWWVYVPAPLCFGLMTLESLRQLLRGPKAKEAQA